ncbi:ZWICHEL kinesin-like calmodulin-binding protein, partial [Prunus dulcis]
DFADRESEPRMFRFNNLKYSDHAYAAGGTLSGSSSVGLLWARHRGDVGTKTGSAPVYGEIPGRRKKRENGSENKSGDGIERGDDMRG